MPDNDSWDRFLDKSRDGSSDKKEQDTRFNDYAMLSKCQTKFWEMVYPGIGTAKVSQYMHVLRDIFCNHLMEWIQWALLQEEKERHETLLRINSNFGDLGDREVEIRGVQAMCYQIFLKLYPVEREKLIASLFEVNSFLARRVEENTRPTGLKKVVEAVTGRSSALIGRDSDGTTMLLVAPDQTQGRKLLEGPAGSVTKKGKGQEVKKERRFTGDLMDPAAIGTVIDSLVKDKFTIAVQLNKAKQAGGMTITLGQLYSAIEIMSQDGGHPSASTKPWRIKRALSPFRKPKRVPSSSLNIFGNVLIECLDVNGDLKLAVKGGIQALCAENDMFVDFAWEFFAIAGGSPASAEPTKAPPKPRPYTPQGSGTSSATRSQTPEMLQPASESAPIGASGAKGSLEQIVVGQSPMERLATIYLSGKVDLFRLRMYDSYVREILNLILCGKKNPLPDEVSSGWKRWMHIVHADVSQDESLVSFSNLISEIGTLARKKEFIRGEGSQAIEKLFEKVAELLETHSALIIPRIGQRHIIVGRTNIEEMLVQKKFDPTSVRVIINGQMLEQAKFSSTELSVNDVVEVVTFAA